MRHLILLLASLSSCTLIVSRLAADTCEDGSPAFCDGNSLVICVDGLEAHTPCGVNTCNAAQATCLASACGNGVVEGATGEQCDDGNNANGDGCRSDCTAEACGDGIQDLGEVCDDNNALAGDGCRADCLGVEVCGDGFLDAAVGEACDDGNTANGDACSGDCSSCGDGVLDPGEVCDDNNTLSGDGCRADCLGVEVCGDGLVDAAKGESCDDGNGAANDGCNACVAEADEFVLCDGGTGGSGELNDPFHSLSAALADSGTLAGESIMILPQSPLACSGATISKSVTLQGLAFPAAGTPPTIDGGTSAALVINGTTRATIKDLILRANLNNGVVQTSASGAAALLRVDVQSQNGGNNAAAIDCNPNNNTGTNGALLVDQSFIHGSFGGGVRVRGSCRALVSNSLLQANGTARGGVKIEGNNSNAEVIYSVFDGNSATFGAFECSAVGKVSSSIVNNNNGATPIDAQCTASFTDTFGAVPPAGNNSSFDPLFLAGFHLNVGSLARDAGDPAPVPSVFDPVAIFSVNVLTHDFAGSSRPLGVAPDMGLFEEP